MNQVRELDTTEQLRDSGFGRPPPRHGLTLLHWFATECVYLNLLDEPVKDFDPRSSRYGFHFFSNKPDNNGVRLLPPSNQSYYSVGNLNHPRASELPGYVREEHTGNPDSSNMDRIIVNWRFDQVYITQHRDRRDFDPNATYRISWSLLKKIRQTSRDDFLKQMGYTHESQDKRRHGAANVPRDERGEERPAPPRSDPRGRTGETSRSKSCTDCCTIL